jgi:membrane protease YdiL (CAAX protease family)
VPSWAAPPGSSALPAPDPATIRTPPPPLRYHRLLRALPAYRWWKPLVALVLAAVFWVILQTLVSLVFVGIAFATGRLELVPDVDRLLAELTAFLSIDATDPLSLVAVIGGVATLLPAVLLGYLCVGLRPTSVLRSVVFRVRWGWLALCLLPALVITLLAMAADGWLLPALAGGGSFVVPSVPIGTFVVSAIVIVIVTPLQSAAEEFGLRGLVQQMIGGWVRPVWVAIVVSTIGFAALHTQYVGWATAEVALFGLVAAFLVWRTGGLEAGIALHAINNTVSFLALASGIGGTTQGIDPTHGASTGDPWSFLVTAATMGLYVLAVHLLARRRGIVRCLEPLPVVPVAVAPTPVAPSAPPPDPATRRNI